MLKIDLDRPSSLQFEGPYEVRTTDGPSEPVSAILLR